jgi:hypothetical protein
MDPQKRIELHPEESAVVELLTGILLSIITCGIYALYWQHKQMETLNAWQEEETYSFWQYLIFGIITCGIYALYTEYKMSETIIRIQEREGWPVNRSLPILCLILSLFVSPIGSMALQQAEINSWYGR